MTGRTVDDIGASRRTRLARARLYFVCEAIPGGNDPEPLLRAALDGGVDIIQLREKSGDRESIEQAAPTFRNLADEYGALFLLNDEPDLAVHLEADGVHVGQDDTAVAEARAVVGEEALIGLSTHSSDQVDAALAAGGMDYISTGPVWETPTKQGRPATGLDLVGHAARTATIPFFAIGGIDPGNVREVLDAGAKRICVVRAIRDAEDPAGLAAALVREMNSSAGEVPDG